MATREICPECRDRGIADYGFCDCDSGRDFQSIENSLSDTIEFFYAFRYNEGFFVDTETGFNSCEAFWQNATLSDARTAFAYERAL